MLDKELFDSLPESEKVTEVLAHGHELMHRIYIYYVVKLFRIDNLFVEIWYQQVSNRIDKVEVVELDDVIHLYESQINISDVFK